MLDAYHASREVAESPVVPFRMKRPLVISFFYGKIGTERLLPVMASSAYDKAKIGIHAIAAAKRPESIGELRADLSWSIS